MPFSISAGERRVNVSGTARLANAKIAVEYGDALKTYYQRFCTSVSTDKKNVKDTLGQLSVQQYEDRCAGTEREDHIP